MILAILTAFFVIFINYIIGKPASEFSPYEIFSGYTIWLSKRRLKELDLLRTYEKQYNENLVRAEKKSEVVALKNDFNKIIYDAAEPFFTWERAVGMCPVCFGFWISLLISFSTLLLPQNLITLLYLTNYFYLNLLIIVTVSHVVIRVLNKII